jgi:hypothetical protein
MRRRNHLARLQGCWYHFLRQCPRRLLRQHCQGSLRVVSMYPICQRLSLLTYFFWSASTLRASSSLYLFAALLVYFCLGSLLARAAAPPCDWKYLVALSLPPVFMRRSCSHCHSVRFRSASRRVGPRNADSVGSDGGTYGRGWCS